MATDPLQRCVRCDSPTPQEARDHTPIRDQVKALLAEARGDRLEALYTLAVTTGMRIGEMFGLKWSDVDLEAGTVQVRRTVAADGAINPPKTASGHWVLFANSVIVAPYERPGRKLRRRG